MARQTNTTMIGGFVVIAFFLLAASVVILGSGKLFKRTETFVLYFDGSIKGLAVGSPVLIKGVQIGSVSSIMISANRENLTMDIPVHVEIEPDKFNVEDASDVKGDPAKTIEVLARRGLRAVLSMQSLITGQLMIELEYYPDTPLNLKKFDSMYPEIPTIPSTTDRVFQTLQKIDFAGLAQHLEDAMVGIDRFVNNRELSESIHSLKQMIDDSQQLVGKLDGRIDGVFDNVENTVSDTRTLVNNVNGQVQPLANDTRQLIEQFKVLVRGVDKQVEGLGKSLNGALTGINGVVSEDAPLVLQIEDTLRNISDMTDSIRQLADSLEQHPEALLKGK